MIKKSPGNRKKVKEYLESLSEDDFIEGVIIPLYNSYGYMTYRINSHGPGEHGKDIIFFKDRPLFYDHEFVIVQAKSEKVRASNVSKFSEQLVRAFKVPFPTKSGSTNRFANYVVFMNSKTHSNDVDFEISYLVDGKENIKILSQENVIELIFKNDFIPENLIGVLEEYEFDSSDFEDEIKRTLYSNDARKINFIFNTKIELEPDLSDEMKDFIIKYIFKIWDEDRTFPGTVKPMKWLNKYFDFISDSEVPRLMDVIVEYASAYPSYEAYPNTTSIVSKIQINQIKLFEEEFIRFFAEKANWSDFSKYPLLMKKFNEYIESDKLSSKYKKIANAIKSFVNLRQQRSLSTGKKAELKKANDLILKYLGIDISFDTDV